MKTNADNIEQAEAAPKKRQLRKKKTDRTICRETLAMTMFQKAMEALETMDVTSLSATNVVHLLESAAKLEKISGESGDTQRQLEEERCVKIYLPDNGRENNA